MKHSSPPRRRSAGRLVSIFGVVSSSLAHCAASAPRAMAEGDIPFPHPVITEVLFNVPRGDDGDANKDGTRDAAGDEFIEVMNPHDKPINLRGYVLTSRLTTDDDASKRGVRFVFPDCELPPGKVAVVFNGHDAEIPGPVGTAKSQPKEPNPDFAGAAVFTMGGGSQRVFANGGDFVLLSAPAGERIDCIWWGESDPEPPDDVLRSAEVVKDPKGSVQRESPDKNPIPHIDLDGRACSPGEIPNPRPGQAKSRERDNPPEESGRRPPAPAAPGSEEDE